VAEQTINDQRAEIDALKRQHQLDTSRLQRELEAEKEQTRLSKR
jgi:chromosome segregation ATPase